LNPTVSNITSMSQFYHRIDLWIRSLPTDVWSTDFELELFKVLETSEQAKGYADTKQYVDSKEAKAGNRTNHHYLNAFPSCPNPAHAPGPTPAAGDAANTDTLSPGPTPAPGDGPAGAPALGDGTNTNTASTAAPQDARSMTQVASIAVPRESLPALFLLFLSMF